MTITSDNFCRIEQPEPGIKVLFFVEFDGDNTSIHQMTVCSIGTVDIKVTLSEDMVEKNWPNKVFFEHAAVEVVKSVREMGFSFREED